MEDQDRTAGRPNEDVSARGVKTGYSERRRSSVIRHVSKTALYQHEHPPLVITLMLVVQLKPPRMPLP